MGSSQRTKGAAYEREAAAQLTALLDREFKRELGQSRDGGGDLTAEGCRLLIECKRRKEIAVYAWMKQAVLAASGFVDGSPTECRPVVPVVAMRADQEETLLVIRMKDTLSFAREVLPDA